MGEIDQERPEAAAARLRLARVEGAEPPGPLRGDGDPASAGAVRAGSDDAAPASVRLSCRFLPPCPGPPRLRRTSCPLESVPPAPWSSRRVAPSAVSPRPRADRPPCAGGPGGHVGRRCRPCGRVRIGSARSCPGPSAVLDATGVRDDGIAGGGVLGVLENGGGRFIREPDCSPLAAAPSLIRLQFAVNAFRRHRLIHFRRAVVAEHPMPPGVGRISVMRLLPGWGPSIWGRLPDDDGDLTAIPRGCQPDWPGAARATRRTRWRGLSLGRFSRPKIFRNRSRRSLMRRPRFGPAGADSGPRMNPLKATER